MKHSSFRPFFMQLLIPCQIIYAFSFLSVVYVSINRMSISLVIPSFVNLQRYPSNWPAWSNYALRDGPHSIIIFNAGAHVVSFTLRVYVCDLILIVWGI